MSKVIISLCFNKVNNGRRESWILSQTNENLIFVTKNNMLVSTINSVEKLTSGDCYTILSKEMKRHEDEMVACYKTLHYGDSNKKNRSSFDKIPRAGKQNKRKNNRGGYNRYERKKNFRY